jgi:peroxiredoxin
VDYTQEFLAAPKLVVVVAYNLAVSENPGFAEINQAVARARAAGYQVIGLSASGPEEVAVYKERFGLDFDFYFCDMTTLKTIVRSNPGMMQWQEGVIKQKLHWSDAQQLKLQ